MTPARVVASIAALRAGQKSQRITVIHSKAGVGVRVSKASSIAGALVGGSPDTAVFLHWAKSTWLSSSSLLIL